MEEKFKPLLDLILKDEILNQYSLNKITKAKYGVANSVYILHFNKMNLILKIYKNIPKTDISDFLMNISKGKGINIPEILKDGIYNEKKYILTNFLPGEHQYEINDEKVSQLVLLSYKVAVCNSSKIFSYTIYDKINEYYKALKSMKKTKLPYEFIKNIIDRYEIIISSFDKKNIAIVHGDISPTNLLWENNKIIGVLDFDEAIYAPIEYDIIVAIIKFCKNKHMFNICLAQKMINKYLEINLSSDINKLHNVWYLYILKVLMEKIYLHELNIIDLYDTRQLQDDWRNWFKLINNDTICEEIFKSNPFIDKAKISHKLDITPSLIQKDSNLIKPL